MSLANVGIILTLLGCGILVSLTPGWYFRGRKKPILGGTQAWRSRFCLVNNGFSIACEASWVLCLDVLAHFRFAVEPQEVTKIVQYPLPQPSALQRSAKGLNVPVLSLSTSCIGWFDRHYRFVFHFG
jgi:hypothetical protein